MEVQAPQVCLDYGLKMVLYVLDKLAPQWTLLMYSQSLKALGEMWLMLFSLISQLVLDGPGMINSLSVILKMLELKFSNYLHNS